MHLPIWYRCPMVYSQCPAAAAGLALAVLQLRGDPACPHCGALLREWWAAGPWAVAAYLELGGAGDEIARTRRALETEIGRTCTPGARRLLVEAGSGEIRAALLADGLGTGPRPGGGWLGYVPAYLPAQCAADLARGVSLSQGAWHLAAVLGAVTAGAAQQLPALPSSVLRAHLAYATCGGEMQTAIALLLAARMPVQHLLSAPARPWWRLVRLGGEAAAVA